MNIAGMLWASIPDQFRETGLKPIKYQDSKEKLAFHMPPRVSTIVSKPGTSAIRGGKKDMYYDEAAFIAEFPSLYQAGLPAITRGQGRVTVVSTPYGESGLYYELWNESKWSHHKVPWWESRFMVRGGINPDGSPNYEPVYEATALAPDMDTQTRIDRFASDKLKEIWETGVRKDIIVFQTEYECMFVDEAEAYYPYDLIMSCKDETLRIFRNWPQGYEAKGDITIGVDLAKERDSTVFTVVDHYERDGMMHHEVVYLYVTQEDYADQFVMLRNLVQASQARRVSIDATGPGQIFYERAAREGFGREVKLEGINFTNKKKEEWATEFKGDLQLRTVSYPNHSELINQIHGIKRTKTPTSLFRFAGDKDDYFWSLMLGVYGEGTRPVRFYKIGAR